MLHLLSIEQDTPTPGHYHIPDFLEEAELNPVQKTFGFKGVGRREPGPGPGRHGAVVHTPAPPGYSVQDPPRSQPSYFFRNRPRDVVTLGVRDKVGPGK